MNDVMSVRLQLRGVRVTEVVVNTPTELVGGWCRRRSCRGVRIVVVRAGGCIVNGDTGKVLAIVEGRSKVALSRFFTEQGSKSAAGWGRVRPRGGQHGTDGQFVDLAICVQT